MLFLMYNTNNFMLTKDDIKNCRGIKVLRNKRQEENIGIISF